MSHNKEPIKHLPSLDWTDTARREIVHTGAELVEQSHVAYRIGNVAVAGLIYYSFTEPPWFWFALARGVTMRHLIDFRRYRDDIPQGALTAIDSEDNRSIRFAKFYGFEETDTIREYHGREYQIFRRS